MIHFFARKRTYNLEFTTSEDLSHSSCDCCWHWSVWQITTAHLWVIAANSCRIWKGFEGWLCLWWEEGKKSSTIPSFQCCPQYRDSQRTWSQGMLPLTLRNETKDSLYPRAWPGFSSLKLFVNFSYYSVQTLMDRMSMKNEEWHEG